MKGLFRRIREEKRVGRSDSDTETILPVHPSPRPIRLTGNRKGENSVENTKASQKPRIGIPKKTEPSPQNPIAPSPPKPQNPKKQKEKGRKTVVFL